MTDAQTPAPRKIGIVGFASSRTQAPFDDASWELWGVNDVYRYVPRVNVTFELHHMAGLLENGRRNPEYDAWLRKGKMPVIMTDPRPEYPTGQRYPYEQVMAMYSRRYFTNSISLMLALAIAELTDPAVLPDGRTVRIARTGCEVGMWGCHMAAETEFAAQRPSVEYFIGIADGCGLPCLIPDSSDLCKATSIYGIDTTAPLRKTLELKIAECTQQSLQVDQQLANLQAQREALMYSKGLAVGAKTTAKWLRANWTMPTDVVKPPEEGKDRHGEAMPSPMEQNGQVPVTVTVQGG